MLEEIFGGSCPSCGGFSKINEPLCEKCLEQVRLFSIFCSRCGFPLIKAGVKCPKCAKEICYHARKVYGLYPYNGPLRDMVLNIKFKYNIRTAMYFKKLLVLPKFDINYDAVFSVPCHFLRKFVRFFYPADMLAKYTASYLKVPIGKGLKRNKNTGFQHKLKSKERSLNVKNVFEYHNSNNKYKNVLLIDDILTTGATLDSCALALKKSGIKRVDCFVLAVRCID